MDPARLAVGRGSGVQPANRYQRIEVAPDWEHVEGDADYLAALERPATVYFDDDSQSIVATNDSPDIGFRWSVNPYRGCAHGCSYCYARPSHEYLGWSAGLDFETRVLVKRKAPQLLRDFLARPGWSAETIAFSGVTDCYQPIERELRLTRGCLEVAAACRQPIGVVTKNALVTRDLDLLAELARHGAARVAVSVTTLDQDLTRVMEPRTSSPAARLRAIRELAAAGVPTTVLVAPIIPGLTDGDFAGVLRAAAEAGAQAAAYTVLRLPTTVRPVFLDWLQRRLPNRSEKVQNAIRATRDGALNSSRFGERQLGTGLRAEQIGQAFRVFAAKFGLSDELPPLSGEAFQTPADTQGQRTLF